MSFRQLPWGRGRAVIASQMVAFVTCAVLAGSSLVHSDQPRAPKPLSRPAVAAQKPQGRGAPIANEPERIVVKLRESLQADALISMHAQTLSVTPQTAAGDGLRGFFARYGVSEMRAVFPRYAAAARSGMKVEQLAESTRQRFAVRARRAAGASAPNGLDRVYVLTCAGGAASVGRLVQQLKADPAVEYAEPDAIVSINATTTTLPNDPYLSSSGSWRQSFDDLWGLKTIGAPEAWKTSTGSGIVVAVVDTGIDYTHADLTSNVWTNPKEAANSTTDMDGDGYIADYVGWNFVGGDNDPFDDNGHGSHVAGTIAASANNGIGVVGVAYDARVMAVKGLNYAGKGTNSALAAAVTYAADRGADVINMSWGGSGYSKVIEDAIEYAYASGAVLVVAAGNEDVDVSTNYPANLAHVIAVSSIDHTGARSGFSNYGTRIDVAAPGSAILSTRAYGTALGTVVGRNYVVLSGTSMAAPHVSGLAALILAAHPDFTSEQVRQALRGSASAPSGFSTDFGYGVVQAAAALTVNAPLEARISSPLAGTADSTTITVRGSARGATFASYKLEWGNGAMPTSWKQFGSGTAPVINDALGQIDLSTLPNGFNTLRLTVTDTSGATYVDRVQITAVTAKFKTPAQVEVAGAGDTVKPGAAVTVKGLVIGSGLRSYTLDWAPGLGATDGFSSAGITLANGGTTVVTDGTLANWDTSSIHQGGYYTLRLTASRTDYTDVVTTPVYFEPDLISTAFPVWVDNWPNDGLLPVCPADGACSLLTSSYLHGTTLGGFSLVGLDGTVKKTEFSGTAYGGNHQPAVVALDASAGDQIVATDYDRLRVYYNDGHTREIVPVPAVSLYLPVTPVVDLEGKGDWTTLAFGYEESAYVAHAYAYRADGTTASGQFPLTVKDFGGTIYQSHHGQVRTLAADVDGDGKKEIVVVEGTSEISYKLRLYSSDGTERTWAAPEISGYQFSLAAGDIDGDGKDEIVVASWGVGWDTPFGDFATIHVFRGDGTELTGWPRQFDITEKEVFSHLAIGDLDRDGKKEIAWSTGTRLYLLKSTGELYSSEWPLFGPTIYPFNFGPMVIGDVDGDGKPEIVLSHMVENCTGDKCTIDEKLNAYRADASLARSWQITGLNGYAPYYNTVPSIGDFSGHGQTEIALVHEIVDPDANYGGAVQVLSTGTPYNEAAQDWPYVFRNRRNNPVASDRDDAPVVTTVLNAASLAGGNVAPGELVLLRGAGLGTFTGAEAPASANVTSLGGTEVLFDDKAVPLAFSQSREVLTTVPASLAGKTTSTVKVRRNGRLSQALTLNVAVSVPGLFTANATGTGALIALNADGSVNSAKKAAARGTAVTVYVTGDGLGANLGPTPIVTASVGGTTTTASCMAGAALAITTCKIDIPSSVTPAAAVPIVLNVGVGNTQAGTTIAVK